MSPSTLTTDPAPSPLTPALRRHAVRRKGTVLTAVPVVQPQLVNLPHGIACTAYPGDWLIANGAQVVAVVDEEAYRAEYEVVDATGLVLGEEARYRIERSLGVGSSESPEHLVTAIERVARLTVGDVRVDFTPGQWEHLSHRAGKMGITVADLLKRIVDRITGDLWNH